MKRMAGSTTADGTSAGGTTNGSTIQRCDYERQLYRRRGHRRHLHGWRGQRRHADTGISGAGTGVTTGPATRK